MDIEAFSDEKFDVISWINSVSKNSDCKLSKEVFINSLASKLQLYVQQVSVILENTSQQILSVLPKVVKDTRNLQSEIILLHKKVQTVQNEISLVQKETGQCMINLERLDELKSKLETAKYSLQESDGWSKLVSELEDLYERGDLVQICEKLNLLQKSLAAQERLSGQNDRENQVEGFKNRLEALASPAVVQCFSVGDIEQSKKYVTIFNNMNRMQQLTQYYRTVQKTFLQQTWTEIIELSENSNRFLYEFYDQLFENYQKQLKWCAAVLGHGMQNEPLMVIIELLPSLQPTRESQILNSLKRSNEKLDLLEEFSDANIHFAFLFQKHFQTEEKLPNEILKQLSSAIFDYFNTFIAQYPLIEQNYLTAQLSGLKLIQSAATETIRSLASANKKLLQWVENSCDRCSKITQNCAIISLLTVLKTIFKAFIDKYKKAHQQLNLNVNIEQNWSLLQSSILLLQSLGEFQLGVKDFEKKIALKILENFEKTDRLKNEYLGYKLLEKRDINQLKEVIQKLNNNQLMIEQKDINGTEYVLFNDIFDLIKVLCIEVHDTILTGIFLPIEKLFVNTEPPEAVNKSRSDLPNCSYAPQEFITKIGQYLLTLPQHLEPLLLSPSPTLKIALECCNTKYSKDSAGADLLLLIVVEKCCSMYQSQVLQIKSLTHVAAKQIATDIEYFGNVLEELGLSLSNQLQELLILLKASPENYLNLSQGCEPVLVTAVKQMRNIILSE